MKKNFIYSLAATFITAAVTMSLTACSEDLVAEKQNATRGKTYTVSIPASMGSDTQTRAVEFGTDGASITTYFESTDKIYVTLQRGDNLIAVGHDGSSDFTPLSVTPDGTDAKKGELSGSLSFYELTVVEPFIYNWSAVDPAEGDLLHLYYRPNYKDNSNGQLSYAIGDSYNYSAATAKEYDFAEATMKVKAKSGDNSAGYTLTLCQTDDETKSTAHFENLATMFRQRLTFKDKNASAVTPDIRKLSVSVKNSYASDYTTYPTTHYNYSHSFENSSDANMLDANGDVYFALMFHYNTSHPAEGNQLTLTAEDDQLNLYRCTKDAPTSGFQPGRYYYGAMELAWVKQFVKPTITRGDGGDVPTSLRTYTYIEAKDNSTPIDVTFSGNSDGYAFTLLAAGTATLAGNGTATYEESAYSEFLYCIGDLTVNLSGNYTINCPLNSTAIYSNDNLKLSGNGTLTVKVNSDTSGGLYGRKNYTSTSSDASALAADGYTVTRSATQDNGDGTYTWTYTVARIPTDLSSVNGDYTAQDGDILTGTLASNLKLKIAAGATVTLAGMTHHAGDYINGIECLGTANIILAAGTTNYLTRGSSDAYAGLFLNNGTTWSTLTISGTGTLLASGGNACAGIGGIDYCDDIVINGGTIYATGGQFAPGIGAGANVGQTGNITINGGNITATGGEGAAGIGAGCNSSECKDITIENTVTSVTAIKGAGASESIGRGSGGNSCGTVKFGTATMFDDSRWTTTPNSGNNYGLLHFVISKTTNPNDTWTLTPLNQGQGGLQDYNVNPANEQ